jgi:glucose-1-phosphate thymidylyltransferase
MIIGIVPVGGKGLRLGLPFSKELLPIISDNYYPVINCTIKKMREAGTDIIFLVHGTEFKFDVLKYLGSSDLIHIRQTKAGFARVLVDVFNYCSYENNLLVDKVLFGLPDSFYEGNCFVDAVKKKESTIILFYDQSELKVDRLSVNDKVFFNPKTSYDENFWRSSYFWGAFVLNADDFKRMALMIDKQGLTEIGNALNMLELQECSFAYSLERYYDLGTWNDFKKFYEKQLTGEKK